MKSIFVALAFSVICTTGNAGVFDEGGRIVREFTGVQSGTFMSPFEVKGRKGSKRIGGRNSKGKGSRYIGGR